MKNKLTKEEHRKIHEEMHCQLDMIIGDFILCTPLTEYKGLEHTSIMELMRWSFQQTQEPTDPREENKDE